MEKKYKLTEEYINVNGRTFYRIEALKNFANVEKGDKGGYIENENNLSQYNDCWIYDNAKVYGDAEIYGNSKVYEDAEVYGNAKIYDNAVVYGYAKVYDDTVICNNAEIYGNAKVYGDAEVYDNAEVCENAKVCGNAKVYGYAKVYGNAEVCSNTDYIVFKNWWSSGRYFTWTRSNNMWKVGCFYGTGKELIEKAYKDSELSGIEYKRVVDYVESILKTNKQ